MELYRVNNSCSRFQAVFSPVIIYVSVGRLLVSFILLNAMDVIHFPLLSHFTGVTTDEEHLMQDVGTV